MVEVKKINKYEWLIEKTGDMKVPVKVFTDEEGIKKVLVK